MHGAAVEVRKNANSTSWYNATLIDVIGSSMWVSFEDNVWMSREVPCHSVRKRPPDAAAGFEPSEEDEVEVMVAASSTNPKGWSLGRVKVIKNGYYFIGFRRSQNSQQDVIVERHALRPASGEGPLDTARLARRLLQVTPRLHEWVRSEASAGCFGHVRARCGLLVCTWRDSGATTAPEVVLVGEGRAVDLAEKLFEHFHFPYQVKMQGAQSRIKELSAQLEEHRSLRGSMRTEVFTVDAAFVGMAVGRHGERLRQVRLQHGVEVRMQPESDKRVKFTVSGQREEDVAAAREQLEFVMVSIPVEGENVGWILGHLKHNIAEIAAETKLTYARFSRETQSLELMGLRTQVDDAKLLISVHCDYRPVYEEMKRERELLQRSFDSLGRQPASGSEQLHPGSSEGSVAPLSGEESIGACAPAAAAAALAATRAEAAAAPCAAPELAEAVDRGPVAADDVATAAAAVAAPTASTAAAAVAPELSQADCSGAAEPAAVSAAEASPAAAAAAPAVPELSGQSASGNEGPAAALGTAASFAGDSAAAEAPPVVGAGAATGLPPAGSA